MHAVQQPTSLESVLERTATRFLRRTQRSRGSSHRRGSTPIEAHDDQLLR
jgi:hypothetical protein